MTFDNEIILKQEIITLDEYNQEIKTFQENVILASKKSISMNEFYKAKNNDLQLDITFIVNSFEYNNERLLTFKNKNYDIVRIYENDNGLTELYCEEVKLNE